MKQAKANPRMPTAESGRSPRPFRRGVLAGLGYAVALSLSIEPIGLWPVAMLALPWMVLVMLPVMGISPVRSAVGVGVGSLPVWAWTHGWVFGIAWTGGMLVSAQMAVFIVPFVWVVGLVRQRWGLGWTMVLWPVVWSGFEWLRSEVFWGGYSWYVPAQGLVNAPVLASAAGVIGFHGVGVLMALLAGGVVCAFSAREAGLVWIGSVVAAWAGLSWWGWSPPANGPVLRVAAVQTSMSQSVRGGWATADRLSSMEQLVEFTQQASLAQPAPDVIVWPETMFPGDTIAPADVAAEREADLIWFETPERGDTEYTKLVWRGRDGQQEPSAVRRMASAEGKRYIWSLVCADTLAFWQDVIGIPMLIGSDGYKNLRITIDENNRPETQFDARYNSVHLLSNDRVSAQRYDKQHLTPFGEVMPVIEHWKGLQDWLLNVGIGAVGMRFDLSRGARGEAATRFSLDPAGGSVRAATPVCFEATSASVCRELVSLGGERRADVLIGLTNDGWFDRWPVGREAHLTLSRWRSVELWTPMVRSANTGVSASVDTHGRVVDRLDAWAEGVLMAEARTVGAVSPYSRGGYVFTWLAPSGLGLIAVVLAFRWVRGIKRRGVFQRPEPKLADAA